MRIDAKPTEGELNRVRLPDNHAELSEHTPDHRPRCLPCRWQCLVTPREDRQAGHTVEILHGHRQPHQRASIDSGGKEIIDGLRHSPRARPVPGLVGIEPRFGAVKTPLTVVDEAYCRLLMTA